MVPVKREGELDVGARDAIKAGEEMVRVAHDAHRIAATGGCVNGVEWPRQGAADGVMLRRARAAVLLRFRGQHKSATRHLERAPLLG